MTVITFDTHGAVKFLMKEGIVEKQAEAIIEIIQKGKNNDLSSLASKEQVTLLEKDVENIMQHVATQADMHQLEKRLEEKSHQSERRLMLMMGSAVATICGFVAALKYLPILG